MKEFNSYKNNKIIYYPSFMSTKANPNKFLYNYIS